MNSGGVIEPTAPLVTDQAGPAQQPPAYQPVAINFPPPPYEFTNQQQYSAPQQPSAQAYYYPAGSQPATNPFPATGFVYMGGPASCSPVVGYIASSSNCPPPVVCGPGYKVEQPAQTGNVIAQRYQQVPRDSYCGYIILSIIVFMCCCPVLGMISFGFSGMARAKAATDQTGARRAGRISLALSISGIAIAVLISIIVVSVLCSSYRIDGMCYRNREPNGSHFNCMFDKFGRNPYHKDGYCYWN